MMNTLFSLSFCFQSGSEKTSARSRLDSSNSITSEQSPVADNSENGGETVDYKALYEAARYVYKTYVCVTDDSGMCHWF